MALASGIRLGPYEIISPLGAGGMGEVYRARDTRLERTVALKIVAPEYAGDEQRLSRFEQEARSTSALNHPGIVTIYDVGTSDSGTYIAMEYVEGRTLRELLEAGPVPLRKVLHIAAQTADALAKAHERGILHRDLKPENVMVTGDGFAKILDFGLAKLVGGGALSSGMTATAVVPATTPGMVLGTVGYMSPEQARGREVDFRSDQFAFGTMLYELLTGKKPFQRESSAQTLAAIIEDEATPIAELNPRVPVALRWIVERCLAKEAEERYASTRDLARDLQSVRDRWSEASSHPSQLGIAPAAGPAARWWKAAAAVAAGVAIGLAAGALLFRAEPPSPPALRPLTFSGSDFMPAVSPDGRTVAFVSARDGKERIWMKQLAGGGEAPLTAGPLDTAPRFSPDGSMILFERGGENGSGSIWRTSVLGSEERRVADQGQSPDWSPDGKLISFTRELDGGQASELVIAEADGSNPKVLAKIEGRVGAMRWSPDGKYFIAPAEVAGLTSERAHFVLVSADGKEQRDVAPAIPGGTFSAVAWTGTPGEIVYTRGESVGTAGSFSVGTMAVAVQNVDTGRARRILSVPGGSWTVDVLEKNRLILDLNSARATLLEVPLATAANTSTYHWLTRGNAVDRQPIGSPDGEWTAFSSNRSGNLDVWAVSRKTGAIKRLTDDPADDWDPGYSPDGKYLIWSSHRSGNFEIWLANADGSNARQVSKDGIDAENPAMSKDGWIVYNSGNPQKRGLWKIRADGTQATRLTQAECNWPDMEPSGEHVVCSTGAGEDTIVRVSNGEIVQRVPIVRGSGRARWLPDGSGIAYAQGDDKGSVSLVARAAFQGNAPERKLIPGGEHPFDTFSFTADGKAVVLSTQENQSSLMIADGVRGVAPPRRK